MPRRMSIWPLFTSSCAGVRSTDGAVRDVLSYSVKA
jgi:hypothetical protein